MSSDVYSVRSSPDTVIPDQSATPHRSTTFEAGNAHENSHGKSNIDGPSSKGQAKRGQAQRKHRISGQSSQNGRAVRGHRNFQCLASTSTEELVGIFNAHNVDVTSVREAKKKLSDKLARNEEPWEFYEKIKLGPDIESDTKTAKAECAACYSNITGHSDCVAQFLITKLTLKVKLPENKFRVRLCPLDTELPQTTDCVLVIQIPRPQDWRRFQRFTSGIPQ